MVMELRFKAEACKWEDTLNNRLIQRHKDDSSLDKILTHILSVFIIVLLPNHLVKSSSSSSSSKLSKNSASAASHSFSL